jgi:hypothetical protein
MTAAGAALIAAATAADQRTTLGVAYGTTGTTVCVGNDSRLSDARPPTAHNQAWSTITAPPTTIEGYGLTNAASTGANTFTGAQLIRAAATQDAIEILGRAGGTSSYKATITPLALSASRTFSLPDENGTIALRGANTFSGVQRFPDGTAAAPAISFGSDPDTGIYRSGANTIGFSVGGVKYHDFFAHTILQSAYGTQARHTLRRANGTEAAPTKVLSNETLGYWLAQGYYDDGVGGVGYSNSPGGIYVLAAEDFSSSTNHGRFVRVYTCPVGTSTGQVSVEFKSDQSSQFYGDVTLNSGKVIKINSVQVITAQQASASQAAVSATAATQTTPWGFSTAAQADGIITLLNAIRAALVAHGLIKGSA